MSKLTRTVIIGATLAAMHLAGMTAVAHARASDQLTGPQATPRPPTEGQVGESWRHGQVASQQQQSAAEAVRKRVEARERFSIPNPSPAPTPPKQGGPSDRLIAWLGGLAAGLVLAGGLAILAARRTRRRAPLEHAA